MAALYLPPAESGALTEEATRRLHRAGLVLEALGIPYIVGADWNVPPPVLEASGWPRRAKVVIIAGGQPMCATGRELDYYVVSSDLAQAVTHVEVVHDAPWRPHLGVRLTIRRRPREVEILRQRRPLRLEAAHGPDIAPWEDYLSRAAGADSQGYERFSHAAECLPGQRSRRPPPPRADAHYAVTAVAPRRRDRQQREGQSMGRVGRQVPVHPGCSAACAGALAAGAGGRRAG